MRIINKNDSNNGEHYYLSTITYGRDFVRAMKLSLTLTSIMCNRFNYWMVILSILFLAIRTDSGLAQIIEDNTLSTVVDTNDGLSFTINGGKQVGTNLFHSFKEFSIPINGEAIFSFDGSVQNVFSRVTGKGISNINGLIRASTSANFFLINPNGIVFGSHARLDVGGSFIASTAEQIVFSDGTIFSSSDASREPLLTSHIPIGLQFRERAEEIENRALGDVVNGSANLQVQPGKTLALVGGKVSLLDQGSLVARGGRIEIGSVAPNSYVTLFPISAGWTLGYENVQSFQNIDLSKAYLSVSALNVADRSGDIRLQGRQIVITNETSVISFNDEIVPNGTIFIKGIESVKVSNNSEIDATTFADGAAGNIIIETNHLLVNRGATITADTQGSGQGGNLLVSAIKSIEVDGEGQFTGLTTSTLGSGHAGNLEITTERLILRNGGVLASSTNDIGSAGNVNIKASNFIEINGQGILAGKVIHSGILARTRGENAIGDGGAIDINTNRLLIDNGGVISSAAEAESTGQAGRLNINAYESVVLSGKDSTVLATSESLKPAGDLTINTPLLTLQGGAKISASSPLSQGGNINLQGLNSLQLTNGSEISATTIDGRAGSLQINAGQTPANSIQLNQGSLTVKATGTGDSGNLLINTRSLDLQNASGISASTISGIGENISLQNLDRLQVNNGQISTATQTGKSGNVSVNANQNPVNLVQIANGGAIAAQSFYPIGEAGDVTLNVRNLTLDQNAKINASNISGKIGGNINLQSLETLQLNDSEISASTVNGQAGSLQVNAGQSPANSIQLNQGSLTVEATRTGDSGNLLVNARSLDLQNGSKISASTISGRGQNISFQNLEILQVHNNSQISTTTATGKAGNFSINSNQAPANAVQITDSSRLATQAEQPGGEAGSISINARNLTLDKKATISASNISGKVGGDVSLQNLETLQVNSSEVSATTADGQAGSLQVNQGQTPVNSIQLNSGSLTVKATGTGNSGNLTVNTRALNLLNNSQVTGSTLSGKGGEITLQGLDTLQVNNSNISASTQSGRAGNLTVKAAESVQLNGTGGLSVEATEGGTAGNLTIETGQMNISDGAGVTVSSPQGQAGNLNITANSLTLNRGTITAETGKSGTEAGANISLQLLDSLRLENESLISATANGDANGGNITINSPFVLAFPPTGKNGSDIIANAEKGSGGNIKINAQGIFGIAERLAIPGDQTNDIDASSEFGASGQIQINTTLDPNRGVIQLPETVVDPTTLIAQNPCKRGTESQFT